MAKSRSKKSKKRSFKKKAIRFLNRPTVRLIGLLIAVLAIAEMTPAWISLVAITGIATTFGIGQIYVGRANKVRTKTQFGEPQTIGYVWRSDPTLRVMASAFPIAYLFFVAYFHGLSMMTPVLPRDRRFGVTFGQGLQLTDDGKKFAKDENGYGIIDPDSLAGFGFIIPIPDGVHLLVPQAMEGVHLSGPATRFAIRAAEAGAKAARR